MLISGDPLLGLAFTLILVAVMQPALSNEIMEKLKNPPVRA